MTIRTLYLCYFGLREPLVQTQVLPYLRELAKVGIKIELLTFEPRFSQRWSDNELERDRQFLADEGIEWFTLPYHKSPSALATAYDIVQGARFAIKRARSERLDVLHARAHVPMAMALLARLIVRCRLIFDFRGFLADEYVDAGVWKKQSLAFRAVKMIERVGLRRADQVVVLTKRMRDWLVEHQVKTAEKIEVIPCCVEFARFDDSRTNGADTGVPQVGEDCFEIVYAGSLIGLYLVEEMGRFFMALKRKRPGAFLRILSISPPEQGAAALKRAGLRESDFEITPMPTTEVPKHLRRARMGLSFRKPAFGQIAASPTKIPEYLAAGLPVVCNAGIGDMDELVEREKVGVVLQSFDDDAYQKGATQALLLAEETELPERAARIAHQYFDLTTIGGPRYVNVYERLEENPLG